MPFYEYLCRCGKRDSLYERRVTTPKKSVLCGCGRRAKYVFSCVQINIDPHKWEPKVVDPSKPWITETPTTQIITIPDQVDKDGRHVACLPELPEEAPEEDKGPILDDWEPPKGEVHPYDFKPDKATGKLTFEGVAHAGRSSYKAAPTRARKVGRTPRRAHRVHVHR